MKDIMPPLNPVVLRQKAEEILKSRNVKFDSEKIEGETLRLIHELDVYQIELEMQNEELILAKKIAEKEAEKYTHLYDFAPTGYLTLSTEGEIVELNFSAANLLGRDRSHLIKCRFGFFVSNDTIKIFNEFIEKIENSDTKKTCEIILNVNPDTPIYVYLTGRANFEEEQYLITMVDISQRKKAEEEIRASEEKYHNLFDSNRDSISLFRLGTNNKPSDFLLANNATSDLFGYSNKEFLTLRHKEIEHITEKKGRIRMETLLTQGTIDFETIIKTKKGNKRNVEVKSVLVNYENEPAIMNITRDVTERKQNEENARKILENLASILESIPDILFEVGQSGMIYHYQFHKKDLYAIPPKMVMGKYIHEVFPPDVAKICFSAIQEASENGRSIGKKYSLDLKNTKRWFEISVSPLSEIDTIDNHYIFIVRDITDFRS